MLKYKVLLVDDEEEVANMIEERINWEELGFEVTGKAQNGVKALEISEKVQPDVVITDIKMPYMNGLELARYMKQENPGVRILILTGFDEFEYAKEAVHLEIDEYILKPVNANELSECLSRLKSVLDKEREEKLNVIKLEQYYADSLPALRVNFFCSLIEGRILEGEVSKFLSDYKISLPGPYFCCAVMHTSQNHVPDGMSPLLLSMSVQREVQERLRARWDYRYFTYLGNIVLIFNLESEDSIKRLTDDCDRFCRWAYRIMGAVVTAGIGRTSDSLFHIHLSYEGAREAVSYRVLYGTKRAISIGEIVPKEQNLIIQAEETRMQELFRAVHVGNQEKIEKAVKKEIEILHKNADTIEQYRLATMEIVSGFYRFCVNNSIDFKATLQARAFPIKVGPCISAWLGLLS